MQVSLWNCASVSRALSRPEMVSPAARDAVFQAVEATGYRMNHAARNLRKQRTGAIVVDNHLINDPVFVPMGVGVAGALHAMGCEEVSLGDTIGVGTPAKARDMLRAVAAERASPRIYLRADGAVAYARVMQVMGALNAAGFRDIVLVTDAGGPRMDG